MNIFILDRDITRNVHYHCDKHVVKMCLEYAQLIDCVNACAKQPHFYKTTHVNHPCAVWARTSLENYQYLMELAFCLGEEYEHRYGKVHKSIKDVVMKHPLELDLPRIGLTPFAKCVTYDELKKIPDVVDAYRQFYIQYKSHFAKWTKREIPDWFRHGQQATL